MIIHYIVNTDIYFPKEMFILIPSKNYDKPENQNLKWKYCKAIPFKTYLYPFSTKVNIGVSSGNISDSIDSSRTLRSITFEKITNIFISK